MDIKQLLAIDKVFFENTVPAAKSAGDEVWQQTQAAITYRTMIVDARLTGGIDISGNARLIDIVGVENSLVPATDLFTKLSYLGLNCRLNTDAYMQQIGAGHLSENDVAVAFSHSGRSIDTIKALRLAKSRGAHTIVVTDSPDAPIGNWADVRLLAGRGERTIYGNAIFSRTAHIAMVDILYMSVILSDYGRFSTELDRSGRYIQDRGAAV